MSTCLRDEVRGGSRPCPQVVEAVEVAKSEHVPAC